MSDFSRVFVDNLYNLPKKNEKIFILHEDKACKIEKTVLY